MFTAQGPAPNTVTTGWKVQAHFAGDSSLGGADSVIRPYNTLKHTVTLVVTAASQYPWGKPTSFTATLKDASLGGAPIEGVTVTFDGTGIIAVSHEVVSDSAGKAKLTGTAPDTVASGWTYQAHFAGDSLYSNKDSTVKTYRTTKHAVTLGVITASVAWGQPNTFTATLKDASLGGAPIEGVTVTFDGTGIIAVSHEVNLIAQVKLNLLVLHLILLHLVGHTKHTLQGTTYTVQKILPSRPIVHSSTAYHSR